MERRAIIMPTNKRRINITINEDLYKALALLSKRRCQSLAGLSFDLIEKAIELEEDIYFSRIADERLSKKERRVPHDKVWK
jgi:predicted DNA-binding protein